MVGIISVVGLYYKASFRHCTLLEDGEQWWDRIYGDFPDPAHLSYAGSWYSGNDKRKGKKIAVKFTCSSSAM